MAYDTKALDMSGFSGPGPSSVHLTGAEALEQDYAIAFVGPLDDIPLSEKHCSEHDLFGHLSDSQGTQLSDRQDQTERMNYRETVRSFVRWDHIPTFEVTFRKWTRQTTLGRERTPNALVGYQ